MVRPIWRNSVVFFRWKICFVFSFFSNLKGKKLLQIKKSSLLIDRQTLKEIKQEKAYPCKCSSTLSTRREKKKELLTDIGDTNLWFERQGKKKVNFQELSISKLVLSIPFYVIFFPFKFVENIIGNIFYLDITILLLLTWLIRTPLNTRTLIFLLVKLLYC